MTKIIAVAGSSGFIGKHLVEELYKKKTKVIEIDIDKGFDLCNKQDVERIPSFDTIVHLAAKSFVPASFEDPWVYYYNNYLVTLNILELARKYGANVIYFSSYLYGEPEYLPINESHPLKPHNPYSQSKLICEKLCEGYSRDFNLPITIFRPFNIYGPGQKAPFLIPLIINQLKTGKITLKDPRPRRDYLYINDFVDAVMQAIEFDNKKLEIFNIGYGKSYSIREIADFISIESGQKILVEFTNEIRQGEVLDTVADNSKIKKILGWEPKTGLLDGLRNMMLKI